MPEGPILVGRVHRTLRDVDVLAYDYDSLNVETRILPAGSVFQPWTPQDHWRGEKVPITLGDQATGFDWGVSSPIGHFLRWNDFFAAEADSKVQVVAECLGVTSTREFDVREEPEVP